MRHRKKRHLRGDKDRRRKEIRALAASLVLYEKIVTTEARAKLARSFTEKLITKGKSTELAAYRRLLQDLPTNAAKKIVEVLGQRYQARPGGYTRIEQLGLYRDGTKKVKLELVK